MTEKEQRSWEKKNLINLSVAEEYFHHHAFEIVSTHKKLRKEFLEALNSSIAITPRIKRTKSKLSRGIEAGHLNIEIRRLMGKINNGELKLEVNEEKGVFYFSSGKSTIGGFDFAIINHRKNLTALRNLCFGELHYHDGVKRWNQFLEKNPDLERVAKQLIDADELGADIEYKESDEEYAPLIVGEIQFGNWALAYRDFFKVLKANVQNSIDCLIYIVPSGNLQNLLSDGIVNFEDTKQILREFAKVISVPVWVIGLDVEI